MSTPPVPKKYGWMAIYIVVITPYKSVMRHHNNKRKFGLEKAQRNALLKGLIFALISEGKIQTTEAKAKEIRPLVEKLITKAKNDTIATRRLIARRLGGSPSKAKLLVGTVAPKY